MTKCIYCRSELNQNSPADEMTRSKEHIVPYALGGSDLFSTMDVSTKYNNDFGRDIDAKFINLLPVSIKRHTLQLAGRSGKIPPIVWHARSLDNKPSTITIHSDGKVECSFNIATERSEEETHENLSVSGSRDQVMGILSGILAKSVKKGKTIYSVAGEEIITIDDFAKHFKIEESDRFKASIRAFDFEIWTRGIFKMILGLGHLILGPEWTFSSDGGDRIRTVLAADREHWPNHAIKGFTTGELAGQIAHVLGISAEVRERNIHTLAILPNESEFVAIVSLFGGKDVPEALVALGSERGKLAVVNEMMETKARIGVHIDPSTRSVDWIIVEDIVNATP